MDVTVKAMNRLGIGSVEVAFGELTIRKRAPWDILFAFQCHLYGYAGTEKRPRAERNRWAFVQIGWRIFWFYNNGWDWPFEELREFALAETFCRAGRHCRPGNRVHKFNGGNSCWLCRNCRWIVAYDSGEERKGHAS